MALGTVLSIGLISPAAAAGYGSQLQPFFLCRHCLQPTTRRRMTSLDQEQVVNAQIPVITYRRSVRYQVHSRFLLKVDSRYVPIANTVLSHEFVCR
jgi:hypothetical protein